MSLDWMVLLVLPIFTAGIGWLTNWVAVKMLFWPVGRIEFMGIGWQGVIYSNRKILAANISQIASGEILAPGRVLSQVDVTQIESLYASEVDRRAPQIVGDILKTLQLGNWEELEPESKVALIVHSKREIRIALTEVLERFGHDADQWLDFQGLAMEVLSENGGRTLAKVLREFGDREIQFLIWFGAVFGFMIGLVEAVLWLALGVWWLLPVVGLIVGGATNWAAIQMIFYPREPIRFTDRIVFQGLLPKHQSELSAQFAAIAQRDVLSAKRIVERLSQGEVGERARVLLEGVLEDLWKEQEFMLRFVAPDIRTEDLDQAKHVLVKGLSDIFEQDGGLFEANLDEALGLGAQIRKQLEALPKREMERLFRGVTERDEPTLIAIGIALGGMLGLVQAMVFTVL
jgi:uncharacterized membrane protein YheB (UPF0754 family)